MINKLFENIVEKVWGWEIWINNCDEKCYKILIVNPGFICSTHNHKEKAETFKVLKGNLWLQYTDYDKIIRSQLLKRDQEFYVPAHMNHRFSALLEPAIVLEESDHHSDSDVYRENADFSHILTNGELRQIAQTAISLETYRAEKLRMDLISELCQFTESATKDKLSKEKK